ncbi:MAG TPA: glycosyl hydrolase family 28-related protein [Candidatus Saccharimonadales bacterium]|nr:glycosyl hydrolase family 28-related protein [Candidatus Saccharimonadales bacterium]
MSRLPTPGSDRDQWGDILNDYLLVAHTTDGTLRSNTGFLNVQDYGAIGDGTIDDTAAIQAALSEAEAAGGGAVWLPAGNYRVTASLYFASKTTIAGAGQSLTKITQATSGVPTLVSRNYLSASGASPTGYVTLHDFKISAPTASGSHGILFRDFYSTIYNVDISGSDRGIYFTQYNDVNAVPSGTMVENRVENCSVRGAAGYAYFLGQSDNNKYTDGFLINCIASVTSGATSHVFIGSSGGWVVDGVHTYGSGLSGASIELRAAFKMSVSNLYIETFSTYGLFFSGPQQSIKATNIDVTFPNAITTAAVGFNTKNAGFTEVHALIDNLSVNIPSTNSGTNVLVSNTDTAVYVKVGTWDVKGTLSATTVGAGASNITFLGSTTSLLSGTDAARPAASSSNTNAYYYATDANSLFQSNGSSWALRLAQPFSLADGFADGVRVSYPRMAGSSAQNVLTSGQLYLTAVSLFNGDVAAGVTMISASTGLTMGSNADGHVFVGLYDASYNLVASSADQGGSFTWTGNSLANINFSVSYSVSASGVYYVGLLISLGTGGSPVMVQPRGLAAGTANFAASSTSGWPSGMKTLAATNGSGLTSLPAGPLSVASATGILFCAVHS